LASSWESDHDGYSKSGRYIHFQTKTFCYLYAAIVAIVFKTETRPNIICGIFFPGNHLLIATSTKWCSLLYLCGTPLFYNLFAVANPYLNNFFFLGPHKNVVTSKWCFVLSICHTFSHNHSNCHAFSHTLLHTN
jgi:hypothetical protein